MLKVYHLLFVLCLSFTACSVLEEPEELTIINIGADYILELSQTLQLGPNALMINVQHSATKNCANSFIDLSASLVGDQIQLVLGEIIQNEPCFITDELIDAQSSFDLSPRQYDINISIKDVAQNHGTIDVSLDSYSIALDSENGILLEEPMIKIIPDQIAWGLITFDEAEHQSAIANLINESKEKNTYHNLVDGNYGYFTIKDSELNLSGLSTNESYNEIFIIKQKESFDELTSRFELLSQQDPSIKIQLLNSTGAVYAN